MVWDRSAENLRFPIENRDSNLKKIVNTEEWIIEGVHYRWGQESYKEADLIFIIQPNRVLKDYRVIKRFIKSRLGIELWNYKQTLKDLFQMLFIRNKDFDKKKLKDILVLTEIYAEKRFVVQNNKEVLKYVQGHLEVASRRQ